MSEENIEIVRRVIDAFTRSDLDAALQDNDPEIVLDWSRSRGLEAGIYHGCEAIRAFWSTFFDTFDPIVVTVDEFIECGEHVVAPNRARFWGRDGIEVNSAQRVGRNPSQRTDSPMAALPHSPRGPQSRGAGGLGRPPSAGG